VTFAADRIREHKERFPHLCLSSMTIGVREALHVIETELYSKHRKSIAITKLAARLREQEAALKTLTDSK
jgi:hypothetical protein